MCVLRGSRYKFPMIEMRVKYVLYRLVMRKAREEHVEYGFRGQHTRYTRRLLCQCGEEWIHMNMLRWLRFLY